jgi:hypothetical protein
MKIFLGFLDLCERDYVPTLLLLLPMMISLPCRRSSM